MKYIFLLAFACLLMSFETRAQAYLCDEGQGTKYLLALKGDSGLVFKTKNGYLQALDGSVKVVRAMDGGPTYVSAAPTKEVDWSQVSGCFEMVGTTHQFVVHVSSRGDTGSNVRRMPEFIINPKKECEHASLPRPMVLPPKSITCELME